MARTKGSVDKAPRKPRSDKKAPAADAGPGHNSAGAPQTTGASTLTDDEQRALFVNGIAELEKLIEEKDSIVGKIRAHRQKLEVRSFSKDDVDFGLALRKGDEKAIVKKRQREQQIARWLNHPVAQLDLFVDGKAPSEPPIDDRAFEEGKIAGYEGKPCQPPSSFAPQTAQRWIEGWHIGQADLQKVAFRGPNDSQLKPAEQPAQRSGPLDDEILDDADKPQPFDAEAGTEAKTTH